MNKTRCTVVLITSTEITYDVHLIVVTGATNKYINFTRYALDYKNTYASFKQKRTLYYRNVLTFIFLTGITLH